MKITRFCPAKVNLFLEVCGKRPNGYHELATLFAKVSLGDRLAVEVVPSGETTISLQLTGPIGGQIPATPENLVWRAAQAFLDFYHLHARVQLTLEKNIPTGAGLGGGSSDAAGVLLALCEAFSKPPLELVPVAARLGADVALFLYPDTFLKGQGIGERLTPLSTVQDLPHLVLIYPRQAVATREVFARLTLPAQTEILTNLSKLDTLINVLQDGATLQAWKPLLFNRLEEYVLPYVPAVQQALQQARTLGNGICLMSGSGSTVFVLVGTKQNALELADKLKGTEALVFPVAFYREPTDANNRGQSTSN